jgi:hypothetical protein
MSANRRAHAGPRRGGVVGKTAVMGLLQRTSPDRHSMIRLEVVPDTKQANRRSAD